MRAKWVSVVGVLLFTMASVSHAGEVRQQNEQSADGGSVESSDFPKVAKDQRRPGDGRISSDVWNNDPPCPDLDCSGGGGTGDPADSMSACLPYKVCETQTYDANKNPKYQKCNPSGERSCAYNQQKPALCNTLVLRKADCGRL